MPSPGINLLRSARRHLYPCYHRFVNGYDPLASALDGAGDQSRLIPASPARGRLPFFLPLVIGQPRRTENDGRHLSCAILDEGQSYTVDLREELRLRLGKNADGARDGVLAPLM